MNTLMINLSRAQREIGELDAAMEALLTEALAFLAPRNGLVRSDTPHAMLQVSLVQLAEIEITLALFCLRWLMIDNVTEFCRKLAWKMAHSALVANGSVLRERVLSTLLKAECSRLPADRRSEQFVLLKDWADSYDDNTPDANSYAIDVARASIADLDFDSLTDADLCALDAPLAVLTAWADLAIVASAEMQIAGRMMRAAEKAEAQWRSGTKLEFDFSGAEIDTAYWELWKHLRPRITAAVWNEAKDVVAYLA